MREGLKYILVPVFLLCFINTDLFSVNYYFSTTDGNDLFTESQAQSPDTPWKTIDKLNEVMHLIKAGDSILFKRGDVFTGQIILSSSGTPENKLVFSAYGVGEAPIIRGNTEIGNWTLFDGNIWVADSPQIGSNVTNLLINGESQQIGRFPNPSESNKGYLTITSHIGRTQFTSDSIDTQYNWTGAEAVIRTQRWVLDHSLIQSHEGNTIYLTSPTSREILDNYGFFFSKTY